MASDKKKKRIDQARYNDPPSPYYYEQNYFPTALIGRALGLHPEYPEPNQVGKGDLPSGLLGYGLPPKKRRGVK